MRIFACLCAVLLACLSMPHQALARDDDEPPECTAANSERVSIADLWSHGRELSGDCVALVGYRAGNVIFTDQRAFYAYNAKRSRAAAGVVGIPYPGMNGADAGLMRGTYYGRVRLCSDDRAAYRRSQAAVRKAAERGEIVLTHLYGFCATSTGPAVRVDTADETLARDLFRLTGDGLRRSLGELVEPPADFAYPATLAWLAEVATEGGCTKGYEPRAAPPGPPQGRGVPLWRPKDDPQRLGALARWCATKVRQTVTFLVSPTSPSAFERGVALDMVHCVCTSENCQDRWPVALIDTGWSEDRPYFCQRVKLRPRVSSEAEGEPTEYSEFSFEFANDYLADGAAGFPEGPGLAAAP
jgi:hypothetical protein